MERNKLFKVSLTWKIHPNNNKYFYTKLNDKIILLRINDFPEESLFTIIDGLNIFDFDDRPSEWKFEE